MYKDFWVYPAVLFSEGIFSCGWTFVFTSSFWKKALSCHSLEIEKEPIWVWSNPFKFIAAFKIIQPMNYPASLFVQKPLTHLCQSCYFIRWTNLMSLSFIPKRVCHCRTCTPFFFFQKYLEIWMNLPVSGHVVTALNTTEVIFSLFKAEATYPFFQVCCNVL